MAKRAAAPAPMQRDMRDLIKDAAAEIIMLTPAWQAMQDAVNLVVEDVNLGVENSAAECLANAGMRDPVLDMLRRDAPALFGAAGVGHNQPPEPPTPEQLRTALADRNATIVKRRDDLLASTKRFHAGYTAIPDDDIQGKAAELVKQLGAADKMARASHKIEKEPWIALGAVVQGFFANIWDPLATAKSGVVAKMDAYARAKAQREREAAAAAAARAKAEADAAAARAAETMEGDDLEDAAKAANEAETAAKQASGSAADHSRTRGEFGAVASLAVTWDVAVTDMALLPDRFKLPDTAALKLALRQAPRGEDGTPQWAVPGTELVRNEGVRVR